MDCHCSKCGAITITVHLQNSISHAEEPPQQTPACHPAPQIPGNSHKVESYGPCHACECPMSLGVTHGVHVLDFLPPSGWVALRCAQATFCSFVHPSASVWLAVSLGKPASRIRLSKVILLHIFTSYSTFHLEFIFRYSAESS